ncbi:hypothetical protein Ddye_003105 [Dipteronia dyeriana]|uniref:Uncharacterized protein n=1 Tax=Dipteronia dyeriana TaxID=168575 RepID=A0AAD9XRI2_9ROSI|nr:hypothetical protein Ddye_003105 [Dipteronia dyeriana]
MGEFLALRECLLMAKHHNLLVHLAEVDASVVASALNSSLSDLGDACSVINDIRALLDENRRGRLLHRPLPPAHHNHTPHFQLQSPLLLVLHRLSSGVAGALASVAAVASLSYQEVHAKEPLPADLAPKEVVLYQYEACPFCNKVKADRPLPKEASCHRKLLSSVAVAVADAESSSPSPGRRPRSCLLFSEVHEIASATKSLRK